MNQFNFIEKMERQKFPHSKHDQLLEVMLQEQVKKLTVLVVPRLLDW
jgi:uncharacterized protein (DUF3820 family)